MSTIKLLTTRRVADQLGFSRVHVCRLVHEGRLKAFAVLDNGHFVFTQAQINESGITPRKRKQ